MKAHQNNPQQGEEQVSDQVKFSVFQSIMDSLFQSFSRSVSVASFQELSACVFSWIEEHCKPQVGHSICTPYTVLLVDGWRTKSCMVLFKVMVFICDRHGILVYFLLKDAILDFRLTPTGQNYHHCRL